ncbi:hypothetical protein YYE_02298 [Plasmodium vinckei vinckei]|nr:hypothetical protein YYE_02298 [Plasmodium vinckei vinckei]
MSIRDMLDNELIILKITEFLNIQEIQNLIIALNINVKTNVYFMRECLSLINIKYNDKDEINNLEIKIENIMNSNVSTKIDENNTSSNLTNLFLQTCNYTDTETNSDASTYGSVTFDNMDKHNNSFHHNHDSPNDEIYNLPFENIFETDLNESPKHNYENDFCKNFFSTINIDHSKVNKKQIKYLLEIKNCLIKNEKKTSDNYSKSENVFNHIWMYMHMRNPIIDIDKEYKNSFLKININNFCHRNSKIQFDIFGIYKYDNKYYSFNDIPWIDIYFKLCLNAICSFCNIKVDEKSNCIFSEKISLENSNPILMKYFNSKSQKISINISPSASTLKNSPENNEVIKNEDIKNEDNYDVLIPFDQTYEEYTTPKKRKLNYFNDFDNLDSQDKSESLNYEIETGNNNNEFFFIKKTHIFCDECYKLVSYKSEVKPIFEIILEDYKLLLQLKLVDNVIDFPQELFCICNYFFLKDRYIEFFKKLSITIQGLRKKLIKKLINNFIFTFTLNFYQYIIKPLLLCDEKKLLNQENFFLVGFYVKYKNLLKLFNSPRITYVYYSFNIIFQKIKVLQIYYKNNYFMKISRSLHFDVITFLEKYKKSQARILYQNISKYVYDHLNYDILSKNNYSEIYEYFFQCLRTYKFT